MKLSIIVPAYNEEKYIIVSLKNLKHNLEKVFSDYEIIVVNDGSTDNTLNLLNQNPNLYKKLFNHDKNRGKGEAVKTALRECSGEYIIFHDADLEYEAKNIWDLYDLVMNGNFSLVLGHRMEGYEINRNIDYFHYYIGVKVLTIIINILYGSQISDSATCFKLIDGNLARSIDFYSKGFALDFEIICKVLRLGHSISECPVNYKQRSRKEGKKIKAVDGFIALIVIILERFNLSHIISK